MQGIVWCSFDSFFGFPLVSYVCVCVCKMTHSVQMNFSLWIVPKSLEALLQRLE